MTRENRSILWAGLVACATFVQALGGATADGNRPNLTPDLTPGSDATAAIQKAIDTCFRAGGGTVTVPTGDHAVKTIRLRSHVKLHLARNARLIASRTPADYAGLIENDRIEPLPQSFRAGKGPGVKESTNRWYRATIRIFNAKDVAITGEEGSEIDGRNSFDPDGEETYRGAHAICINLATNVTLQGYAVRDAGNYSHFTSYAQNVTVRNVKIRGGHDGLDFFFCRDIAVEGCDIESGDDCVAGYGNRNMKVRGCRLNSACSVFRIGGNDVLIEDVTAVGPGTHAHRWSYRREDLEAGRNPTDYGRRNTLSFFTFFTGKRATAPAGNIVFRNCRVTNVDKLMHLNFSGNERWQDGIGLHDVTFENLTAEQLAGPACVYAAAGCPTEIRFVRSRLAFRAPVTELFKGANLGAVTIDGLKAEGAKGPFLRSWHGTPEWKAKDVEGITSPVEKGEGAFYAKPI